MTHAIPVPADRYDSAYQPATSVQSWKKQKTIADLSASPARTAARAVHVNHGANPIDSMMAETPAQGQNGFANALAEVDGEGESSDFEFDDFIDIINPLHHLPVIGMIYRSLTGDTIKPVASIVGGGIFGGPMGAAGGVANAIVQHETGKDIAGNVFALVTGDGNNNDSAAPSVASGFKDDPETQLSIAAASHGLNQNYDVDDRAPPPPFAGKAAPDSAIGFVDMKAGTRAYEKTAVAGGRTAGWHINQIDTKPAAPITNKPFDARALVERALPPREPMTNVSLNSMPGLY